MAKKYWLMKTEPTTFSYEDLLKSPKKTTSWEGVRNYQARNLMRDEMKKGDEVLFYHSSCDVPAIVGLAEIVREAYPDGDAFNSKSKYFDKKAKAKGVNPWVMVDVKAKKALKPPVTRDQLKAQKSLKDMMVLKKGSRLSIQPVTASEYKAVLRIAGS